MDLLPDGQCVRLKATQYGQQSRLFPRELDGKTYPRLVDATGALFEEGK